MDRLFMDNCVGSEICNIINGQSYEPSGKITPFNLLIAC